MGVQIPQGQGTIFGGCPLHSKTLGAFDAFAKTDEPIQMPLGGTDLDGGLKEPCVKSPLTCVCSHCTCAVLRDLCAGSNYFPHIWNRWPIYLFTLQLTWLYDQHTRTH